MADYDIDALVRDPDFQRRSFSERRAILNEADPQGYGALDQRGQTRMLADMKNQDWWQDGASKKAARQSEIKAEAPAWKRGVMSVARPVLEGVGMVGGGILGSGAAPVAGTVAGAGLGYAAGSTLADMLGQQLGTQSKPTLGQAAAKGVKDIGTGLMYETGGQLAPKVASLAAAGVGKVAKPLLGKLSGVGPGAIEEAVLSGTHTGMKGNPLKSRTQFDQAMRGNVTGEEIVDNARTALNLLKDKRATAYQQNLQQVGQNTTAIDTRPMKQELVNLMGRYNVKVDPQGKLDMSRVAMGKTGRNDIKEIVETVSSWGSKPGDNTALGLDTLKRQLDDFYSDSSQARQFVTAIRNNVKDTIVKAVPQYDEMTKGYSEATKLIKDVEADLMLRKQGMSGRVTADKTLRRLMSSMRDNFEMRRELVEILGDQGGKDLSGQIAGYTMNTAIPRGLAGTGPALTGQAAFAHFINPSFYGVIAASSPRVQGEFLRLFGKGLKEAGRITPAMRGLAVKGGAILAEPEPQ